MDVQLFWHAAVMGTWRRVTAEQAALFSRVGLRPKIGVLGTLMPRFHRIGEVVYHSTNIGEFETPTLQALWEWCQDHPDDAVIYCHTKGVSKPGRMRRAWRKLMEHWVIERWKDNLLLLQDHDAIGVNWRPGSRRWQTPHFTGTFWMARADWINKLPSPIEHRAAVNAPWKRQNRRYRWARMHAEMWIGASPGIREVSLACRDIQIPRLTVLLPLLKECGHPEYR